MTGDEEWTAPCRPDSGRHGDFFPEPPAPGLRVVASPNPFSNRVVDLELPAGGTIFDLMMAAGCDRALYGGARVYVVDRAMMMEPIEIESHNWRRVYPKPGMFVSIRVTATPGKSGGGGKNPLRTILTIAVMAAAFYVGGAVAGWASKSLSAGGLGWGAMGAKLLGAGVGALTPAVGTVVINSITAPK